jgi:multicomponent Na+:H+ antiporter subunit G
MSGIEVAAVVLAHIGGFFMLVAAIGVARMPDVILRLHCIAKSATLGVGFLLVAACLSVGTLPAWARGVAAIAFFLLTAPVGAHVLARAALSRRPMRPHYLDEGAGDVMQAENPDGGE